MKLKLKNGSRKIELEIPCNAEEIKEIERIKGLLELDIKLVELDLRNINDPETRRFAERRLEELRSQLSTLNALLESARGGANA